MLEFVEVVEHHPGFSARLLVYAGDSWLECLVRLAELQQVKWFIEDYCEVRVPIPYFGWQTEEAARWVLDSIRQTRSLNRRTDTLIGGGGGLLQNAPMMLSKSCCTSGSM